MTHPTPNADVPLIPELDSDLEHWQATRSIHRWRFEQLDDDKAYRIDLADGARFTLPTGHYVLIVHAPARLEVRVPFVISRGQTTTLPAIALPWADAFPSEHFVPVPPMQGVVGGDAHATSAGPARQSAIPTMLAVQRVEVTVRDYLSFLSHQLAAAQQDTDGYDPASLEAIRARLPHRDDPSRSWQLIERPDGEVELAISDDILDAPVHGVSLHDAQAYARWLAEHDDRRYRLPTESEWELIARGPAGHTFPWGDGFDARYCRMADSIPGDLTLGPMGVHKTRYLHDESVHGVFDLAGSVREWTTSPFFATEPTGPIGVVRGGAYRDGMPSCRAASRRPAPRHRTADATGFRLVFEVEVPSD